MNRRQFVKGAVAGAVTLGVLRSAGVKTASAADAAPTPTAPVPGGGVFRSDLSRAQPASALTRDFAPGRWQLVDYETDEGVKGSMLYARPEEECDTLTLPLEFEGPHRIYLAFNTTNSHYVGWSSHGQIDVRLTRDPGFKRVVAETGGEEGQPLFKSVQECYWKTADLTGQSLQFRQPQAPYRWPRESGLTNLSYVRLVPVNEREWAEWRASLPTEDTKRLALIYCTAQLSGSTDGTENFHPTSQQWFVDDFEATSARSSSRRCAGTTVSIARGSATWVRRTIAGTTTGSIRSRRSRNSRTQTE